MITLFDSGGGRTGWIKNFGERQKEFDELGIAATKQVWRSSDRMRQWFRGTGKGWVFFLKKTTGTVWTIPLSKRGGLNDSSETLSSSADWMHQRFNLSLLFLKRIMIFCQQKNHFRKIRLSAGPAGKRNLVPCRNSVFKHLDRFLFFSQEVFGKISQVFGRQKG